MPPLAEVVPGAILGTMFTAWNLVDVAMCISGTSSALSYYRAFPLPIIGQVKTVMVFLIPFMVLDGASKFRAFLKDQTKVTFVGLINVLWMVALFIVIPVFAIPSEQAVLEPLQLKGTYTKKLFGGKLSVPLPGMQKAKAAEIAAIEDALVDDLFIGAFLMLIVNLGMLALPIWQTALKVEEAAQQTEVPVRTALAPKSPAASNSPDSVRAM